MLLVPLTSSSAWRQGGFKGRRLNSRDGSRGCWSDTRLAKSRGSRRARNVWGHLEKRICRSLRHRGPGERLLSLCSGLKLSWCQAHHDILPGLSCTDLTPMNTEHAQITIPKHILSQMRCLVIFRISAVTQRESSHLLK